MTDEHHGDQVAAVDIELAIGAATRAHAAAWLPGDAERAGRYAKMLSADPGYRSEITAALAVLVDAGRLMPAGTCKCPPALCPHRPEPAGCPKTMWDGPASYRCGQGAESGVCPTHGRFRHESPPAPVDPDRPCPHEDMHLDVDVQRLTASEDDPTVVAYIVELQVRCAHPGCGERFRWRGAPAGMMPDRPACAPDEFTLYAPIRPASADPDFGLGIPGFAVQYRPEVGHG